MASILPPTAETPPTTQALDLGTEGYNLSTRVRAILSLCSYINPLREETLFKSSCILSFQFTHQRKIDTCFVDKQTYFLDKWYLDFDCASYPDEFRTRLFLYDK